MGLNFNTLNAGLVSIFTFESLPEMSLSQGLTSTSDAAGAWARVLVSYLKTASAGGAVQTPGVLDTQQAVVRATLLAGFLSSSLGTLIRSMSDALFLPPLTFAGGWAVTSVTQGQAAAEAAIRDLPLTADNVGAAFRVATILDTYTRTCIVTQASSGTTVPLS
jgi:hypothetical protein